MTTSSRPARPGFRPLPGSPGAPAPAAAAPALPVGQPESHQDHPEFEALRQRHQQLLTQRNRFDLLSEQASNEVAACQRQAEAMGINSLEELQQRIRDMEAQDAQALATFQEKLKEEEALQEKAKRRLAEIDSEEA